MSPLRLLTNCPCPSWMKIPSCAMREYANANCARAYTATVNWLMLTRPMPNCEMVTKPQANWPIAMMPLAGTGTRLGLYLKEMCTIGSPRNVVSDLYSKPQPSHLAFAGNGAPQLGQDAACSEISCRHSLQDFISSALSPFCWAKVVLSGPEDTRETTGLEEEKVGRLAGQGCIKFASANTTKVPGRVDGAVLLSSSSSS
jgi:hypothetical protein